MTDENSQNLAFEIGKISGQLRELLHTTNNNTQQLLALAATVSQLTGLPETIAELNAGAPSSHTGIEITNNAFNQNIELRQVSNPNLIQTVLSDLQNSVTFAATDFAYYATPDVGMFPQGQQTLTYSASITPNLALGNYCVIVVGNTSAFTINAPTNAAHIQDLYFEIVNVSGGAMGAITWDATGYPYKSWTAPANGFRKVVHFHRRSSTGFAQVAPVSPDM